MEGEKWDRMPGAPGVFRNVSPVMFYLPHPTRGIGELGMLEGEEVKHGG